MSLTVPQSVRSIQLPTQVTCHNNDNIKAPFATVRLSPVKCFAAVGMHQTPGPLAC